MASDVPSAADLDRFFRRLPEVVTLPSCSAQPSSSPCSSPSPPVPPTSAPPPPRRNNKPPHQVPDTSTRESYLNVADNPTHDTARPKVGNAGYAVFGRVIDGLMVVDFIRSGETTDRPDVIVDGEGMKNVPVQPVVITKV